jgi:NAD(P)-dependent dehydrogenase (short-subunit alcohol dehydrogenase family)
MTDTVVITGAAGGVGRATARAFGERGCRVGLLARGEDGLQRAAAEIERAGGQALVLPVDVADANAVEAAAEAVENRFGPIDIWVNVAMATIFGPVHRVTPEEFRRATEVSYLGFVYGTMAALKRMRPRNRGTIVQVGSALSYRAVPLQSAYCGAKFAIRGFTQALHSELLHDGVDIHLTMVQMPALNTPQFSWARNKMARRPQPVPPIFQPEVAATAIIFAAYSRRREIWVGWPSVKSIIAAKFAPGLLNHYLASRGYRGQLTDEPADRNTPDNLFNPLPGDFGAHGRFDDRATEGCFQLWATRHRTQLIAGAAMLGAVGLAAWFRGSRPAIEAPACT